MSPKHPDEKPLQSWKEIASYLERDTRTAIRWEKREGLPVRRHTAGRRSSVYAYPSELDAWRAGHRPRATARLEKLRSWSPLIPAVAGTIALAAVALLILNGPVLNPPAPLAEAAEEGIQARQIWTGPHADIGAVSSDGRYLTLVDRDGNLAIRDLQESEDRALTNTSWQEAPSEYSGSSIISPDGSQIAFAWINERRSPRIQIRVGSLSDRSGTFAARAVYENEDVVYAYPAGWFPDGNEILAVLIRRDRTYQIARLSLEANAPEILRSFDWGEPEGVSLSPGGEYVLYHFFPTEGTATRDLYLLSTDEGRETRLVEHPADDRALGWTPNGKHVLFSSDRTGDRDLYAIPVEQGKPREAPRLIKRNLGRANPLGVAEDGSLYYSYSTGTNQLYSVSFDPDAGALEGEPAIIHTVGEGFTTGPAWSPDGKILAYTVQTGGGYNSSWMLVLRNTDTGEERRLPLALVRNRSLEPVWSFDGQSLLVPARDRRTRDGLFRIDPQTGTAETLALTGTAVFSTAWAPDGNSIFYVVGPHDDRHLFERSLATGDEKELFSGAYFQRLAVSPKGNYLAVALQHAIVLMSIADKSFREAVRIPDDPEQPYDGIGNIAWADNGTLLFVRVSHAGASLWSTDVNSGSTINLGLTRGRLGQWGLSVRPDRRSVVFHASGPLGSPDPIDEVWQLVNLPWAEPKLTSKRVE